MVFLIRLNGRWRHFKVPRGRARGAHYRNDTGLAGGFGLAATSIGGFVLGLRNATCATIHADSATAVDE
jgi:hypothetical protein